jgi:hypothetical protein
MKKVLFALALVSSPALAADLPPVFAAKAPVAAPCTITDCSGFYIGMDIAGAGTNLDVLGSVLGGTQSGTVNNAAVGAIGGWQYWSKGLFLGAQVFIDYANQPPQINGLGNNSHWLTGELVQVGGNVAGLLGTTPGTTTPTQGPIQINIPGWALVSPFAVAGGVQRGSRNGLATGAGFEFIVAPGMNVLAEYIHVNYNGGQPVVPGAVLTTEDIAMLAAVKKF